MPGGSIHRKATCAILLSCVLALAMAGCQQRVAGRATTSEHALPGNIAVIDAAATKKALDAVGAALEAVFSYDTDNLAPHRAAVREYLTTSMQQDIKKILSELDQQQDLVVDSTVIASGAATLTRSRAVVLCYIAMTSTRKSTGETTKGISPISTVAIRKAGSWKIAKITVPAVIEQQQAAPRGPGSVRDAAVAAARRIGPIALSLDPADPEGTLARWRSVATGALLNDLTSNAAQLRENIAQAEHTVDAAAQAAAVSELDTASRRATVLLTVEITWEGTDRSKMMALRMIVVAEGGSWKVAKMNEVKPE